MVRHAPAPRRPLVALGLLLVAVVGSAAVGAAPGPGTGPGQDRPPGRRDPFATPTTDALAAAFVGDEPGYLLALDRATLPPGATLDAGAPAPDGSVLLVVEAGAVTAMLAEGEARADRTGAGPPLAAAEPLVAGRPTPLAVGDWLSVGPWADLAVGNAGDTDAVVLVVRLVAAPPKM